MLDAQEKRETLLRAAELLAPALANFHFRVIACGCGAGGAFAHGEFALGERRVVLLIRHQALLVIYRIGNAAITHHQYFGPPAALSEYGHSPQWFAGSVLAAVASVKRDLALHGADFVHGHGERFLKIAARLAKEYAGPVVLSSFQRLGSGL